jgi:hypothetical protein
MRVCQWNRYLREMNECAKMGASFLERTYGVGSETEGKCSISE